MLGLGAAELVVAPLALVILASLSPKFWGYAVSALISWSVGGLLFNRLKKNAATHYEHLIFVVIVTAIGSVVADYVIDDLPSLSKPNLMLAFVVSLLASLLAVADRASSNDSSNDSECGQTQVSYERYA